MSRLTLRTVSTELTNGLAAVSVAMSKDAMAPVLASVRVERTDDHTATLLATDRYRVARVRIPARWTGDGTGFQIEAADVKRLITDGKARIAADRRLTTHDYLMTLEVGSDERLAVSAKHPYDGTEASFTTFAAHGDYPRVGQLFPDTLPQSEGMVAVNPAFLADFAKVKDIRPATAKDAKGMPLVLHPNGAKPVLVTVGDWFTGLLMPVTGTGGTPVVSTADTLPNDAEWITDILDASAWAVTPDA